MAHQYPRNKKELKNSDEVKDNFFSLLKQNSVWSFLTGVYIFLWFIQIGDRIELFKEVRFEFILGSLLTIGAIVTLLSNREKINNEIKAPALILIIYFSFFVILSVDMELSWQIYFNFVIKYSLVTLFIAVFIDTLPKLKFLFICFFAAVAKLAQEGFNGWLFGGLIWQSQGVPRLHGSIDRLGHPNSFSGFAVSMLPFIYYYYRISSPKLKLFFGYLGGCMLIIIMATGSRTGYVATVLLSVIVFWKTLKKNFIKSIIIFPLILTVTIQFLPDSYKARFESIYTQNEIEGGSTGARIQIIEDAVEVFSQYPMGVGIAGFPTIRMEMFGRFQDTHNMYLQILTNTGFIGLLLFLFLIIRIIKVNKNVLLLTKDKENEFAFLRATSSALIGYILARLFLGIFGMDMYEIYWWFAGGLTIACHSITTQILSKSKDKQLTNE
ncbi:MAG: putative inorganic carbon (HCO3(-)) transporter [Colwellia sp.]